MDMDTLMFTRTVIIIMDLMDMRLIMIMARGLLSLDTALLMSTLSRRTMDMVTQSLTNMDTTSTKDLLSQDMVMVMDMAQLMCMLSRRTMDMVTLNLMNMDTTSIKDLLNLDMDRMKVTKKFPTLHTPIMISKCTTLTKQMEIVPHFRIHAINLLSN